MTENFISTDDHYVKEQFTDPVWCYSDDITRDNEFARAGESAKSQIVADDENIQWPSTNRQWKCGFCGVSGQTR